MRGRQTALQRDLFEADSSARAIKPDQRARLIPLLEALLAEVMTSQRAATEQREGGHDQDHA